MKTGNTRIETMSVKRLKQELIAHGLPVDGRKPALIARLQQAMPRMSSNEAFHTSTNQKSDAAARVAVAEKEAAEIEIR